MENGSISGNIFSLYYKTNTITKRGKNIKTNNYIALNVASSIPTYPSIPNNNIENMIKFKNVTIGNLYFEINNETYSIFKNFFDKSYNTFNTSSRPVIRYLKSNNNTMMSSNI